MGQHLPQTSPGHEKPPDIAFAREELPLIVRDPRASRMLVDINELSRRLSIAKGTLYNWVYLRRIPYVKAGRCLRFDPDKVFESLRQWSRRRRFDRVHLDSYLLNGNSL